MPEITIKMDGADAVRERLREISSRVSNMSPIMKAIGDRIVEQTKKRFEAGGPAPDGTPWVKPKTPNPKRRGTLRVSDQLRDSIRAQMIGNNAVAIGTNKIYAAIHHFGGRTAAHIIRPRNKKALFWPGAGHPVKSVKHPGSVLPARPFLGLSRENSDELLGIINEWIMGRR
jgi:phage virion morphogenesis protein